MLLLLKTHVEAYTRKDGVIVGAHDRRPMYVSRKVLNGKDIHDWAVAQGFTNVTPPEKMHVTVAYSRAPVHHESVGPDAGTVMADPVGLGILGDDDASVLHIDHPHLQTRFQHMLGLGASWDHEGGKHYKPHVTVSYKRQTVDHAKVQPYTGEIHLGPEKVEDLKSGWGTAVAAGAMAKALDFGDLILFMKARVGPYLRGGKLVNVGGYDGKTARGTPAPGQLSLFASPSQPDRPNPYKGKDPVLDTPDLFTGETRREAPVAPTAAAPAPPPAPAKPHPLDKAAARLAEVRAELAEAQASGDKSGAHFYTLVLEGVEREHRQLASAFEAFNKHGDGTELSDKDGKRHAILLPDASSPGKYRYQMFDDRGFSAHSTHDSPEAAVADAASSGFHVHNPGVLDKLAGTDEWAHGMAMSAIMQAHNGGQIDWKTATDRMAALHEEREAKKRGLDPDENEADDDPDTARQHRMISAQLEEAMKTLDFKRQLELIDKKDQLVERLLDDGWTQTQIGANALGYSENHFKGLVKQGTYSREYGVLDSKIKERKDKTKRKRNPQPAAAPAEAAAPAADAPPPGVYPTLEAFQADTEPFGAVASMAASLGGFKGSDWSTHGATLGELSDAIKQAVSADWRHEKERSDPAFAHAFRSAFNEAGHVAEDIRRLDEEFPKLGIKKNIRGPWALDLINRLSQGYKPDERSLSLHSKDSKAYAKVGGKSPAAAAPVHDVGDDHPSKPTKSLLSLVPEDKRAEWLDLHKRQHEMHHYDLGQLKEQIAKHRTPMHRALTNLREAEALAVEARKGGDLPGTDERIRLTDNAVAQRSIEFQRHSKEVERLKNVHQQVYEKVAALGRQKNAIASETGGMDIDFAAMRQRTPEDQGKHEAWMLKRYRAHYKAQDAERRAAKKAGGTMAKAWDWFGTEPVKGQLSIFNKANSMNKPIFFLKSHVSGYTRKDGTFVAEHEDKRHAAMQELGRLASKETKETEWHAPHIKVPDLKGGEAHHARLRDAGYIKNQPTSYSPDYDDYEETITHKGKQALREHRDAMETLKGLAGKEKPETEHHYKHIPKQHIRSADKGTSRTLKSTATSRSRTCAQIPTTTIASTF